MTDARWRGEDGQGGASRPGATETTLSSAEPARQRVLDQIEIWRKELVDLARSNCLRMSDVSDVVDVAHSD